MQLASHPVTPIARGPNSCHACRRMMRCPPGEEGAGAPQQEPQPEPDNFSRVDMRAEPAVLAQQFPDFRGAAAALIVELSAGVWRADDLQ